MFIFGTDVSHLSSEQLWGERESFLPACKKLVRAMNKLAGMTCDEQAVDKQARVIIRAYVIVYHPNNGFFEFPADLKREASWLVDTIQELCRCLTAGSKDLGRLDCQRFSNFFDKCDEWTRSEAARSEAARRLLQEMKHLHGLENRYAEDVTNHEALDKIRETLVLLKARLVKVGGAGALEEFNTWCRQPV